MSEGDSAAPDGLPCADQAAILSHISHQLKNDLGVLSLSAASLLRHVADTPERRAAERVGRATERLARSITDLVDFGRLEAGVLELQTGLHDARALAGEALEARREAAAARGVELTPIDRSLQAGLECDRARIVRALGHLLDNALEAAPRGSRVELTVEGAAREVRFEVRDRGPGIPGADPGAAFQPFWRGRRGSGLGLGLTVARGFALAHGGALTLAAVPDGGTRAILVLPRP